MKNAAPVNIEHRNRAEEALGADDREFGLFINAIPALAWFAHPMPDCSITCGEVMAKNSA